VHAFEGTITWEKGKNRRKRKLLIYQSALPIPKRCPEGEASISSRGKGKAIRGQPKKAMSEQKIVSANRQKVESGYPHHAKREEDRQPGNNTKDAHSVPSPRGQSSRLREKKGNHIRLPNTSEKRGKRETTLGPYREARQKRLHSQRKSADSASTTGKTAALQTRRKKGEAWLGSVQQRTRTRRRMPMKGPHRRRVLQEKKGKDLTQSYTPCGGTRCVLLWGGGDLGMLSNVLWQFEWGGGEKGKKGLGKLNLM